MRLQSACATIATVAAACCNLAAAFDRPADKAGPVTVRIDGPEVVKAVEVPVAGTVVVENVAKEAVDAEVEFKVIDRWRVEPQQRTVKLPASGTVKLPFKLTAGAGIFNAHYPLHVYLRFEHQGERYEAHPILIFQTQLARPPQPELELPWRPIELHAGQALALWRAPVRRVVIKVFGREPQLMPVGWTGSEPASRASIQLLGHVSRGEVHEAISIHPPWYRGQAGTALVEVPVKLPAVKPIRLRLAMAIRDHDVKRGEPPSDGVTFRVRIAAADAPAGTFGTVVFARHTAAKRWEPAVVDLSEYAGRAIRVQLESHPGPKRDTTCDQSFWAEPIIEVGEVQRHEPPTIDEAARNGRELGQVEVGGRRYWVKLQAGRRGLLDATIVFCSASGRPLGFRGMHVRVLDADLADWRAGAAVLEAVEPAGASETSYTVRHQFNSFAGRFDLLGRVWVDSDVLRIRFWLENVPAARPWLHVYIQDMWLGPWSHEAVRIYAGPGNVIQRPRRPFSLDFDGHRLSTSFVGMDFAARPDKSNGSDAVDREHASGQQCVPDTFMSLLLGVDHPPDRLAVDPQAHNYSLHAAHGATLTLIPAANVWQAVRVWRQVNGWKPAGGVKKLAGRFVFDLWGGRYADAARQLERAFRYGLTDALVVWHDWQRWGYDYRLPDIWPPNPRWGTRDEFRQLVQTCKRHGLLFAPHDNYIDFYPDADGYSYELIAFRRDRWPVRAWYNRGRQAQSYRWRADRLRPFLERNLKLIRNDFAPTAYFIDVWSSIRPYDYWTHDGQFHTRLETRQIWGEAFAWIREYLGDEAPQISESGHDQLIGYLDGAQTNHLRVDRPPAGYYSWAVWNIDCEEAERTPWFDAAHHDRFILHGAGYEPRYASGQDRRLHGIYSDDYITTEVLTGHPAMVAHPFGRDVVRKYWLLGELGRALALRQLERVDYVAGNLHRQMVHWSGGGAVWVNRGEQDWQIEGGHTLPQFGFYARVPLAYSHGPEKSGNQGCALVEAAVERRGGLIVEWARTSEHLYVNARPVVERMLPIRPQLGSVTLGPERAIEVRIRWQARKPLPVEATAFVHFVDREGNILFQADHRPQVPTTQWQGTIETVGHGRIPEQHKPGDLVELRVGLYHPPSGIRGALEGPDDGQQRIRLATITFEGTEGRLTGLKIERIEPVADPWLARQNPSGKLVSFGPIRTNGACRISRDANGLLVVLLPEGPAAELRINWSALPWQLARPTGIEAIDEQGKVTAKLQPTFDGDWLVLQGKPDTFGYRLH